MLKMATGVEPMESEWSDDEESDFAADDAREETVDRFLEVIKQEPLSDDSSDHFQIGDDGQLNMRFEASEEIVVVPKIEPVDDSDSDANSNDSGTEFGDFRIGNDRQMGIRFEEVEEIVVMPKIEPDSDVDSNQSGTEFEDDRWDLTVNKIKTDPEEIMPELHTTTSANADDMTIETGPDLLSMVESSSNFTVHLIDVPINSSSFAPVITDITDQSNDDETVTGTVVPQVKPSPFQCPSCKKVFKSKKVLQRHQLVYHPGQYDAIINQKKPKPIGCNQCSKSFASKWYMERHRRRVHSKVRLSGRLSTPKTTDSVTGEPDEMKSNSNLSIHPTDDVRNRLSAETIIEMTTESHQAASQSDDDLAEGGTVIPHGKHKKLIGSKVFTWQNHQLVNPAPHNCQICGERFNTLSSMTVHQAVHHKKIKYYSCDQCSKSFSTEQHMQGHRRRAHSCIEVADRCAGTSAVDSPRSGHSKATHSCDECSEVFFYERTLQTHLVEVHGIAKPAEHEKSKMESFWNPASLCETVISSPHNRKTNQETNYPFPYKCRSCKERFPTLPTLNAHQTTHHQRGAMSFRCDQCSKSFSTKAYMQAHHEKVHGVEHPSDGVPGAKTTTVASPGTGAKEIYRCEECPKIFTLWRSFRTHRIKVHDAFHPKATYSCEKCPKVYNYFKNLQVHLIKVHGDVGSFN